MLDLYKTICGDTIINNDNNPSKENGNIVSLSEQVKNENRESNDLSANYINKLKLK